MAALVRIVALVFLTTNATAASAEVTREAAHAVLEKSGIYAQAVNSAAGVRARFEKQLSEMPERFPPQWLDPIVETFQPLLETQKKIELLADVLTKELSEDDVFALNEFYDSRIGRRIVSTEIAASTLAAWNRIDDSWDSLEARLDRNPGRERLLARLDQSRRYSEIEAAATAAPIIGVTEGMMLALGKEPDVSYEVKFEIFRTEFLRKYRNDNLIVLIYTYGPITDSEIEEYLEFLNTPAVDKFFKAVELAQREYYFAAGKRVSTAVAELFRDLFGTDPTATTENPAANEEAQPTAEVTSAVGALLENSGVAKLMAGYAADPDLRPSSQPYALDFESVHPELKEAFVGLFRQTIDAEVLVEFVEFTLSRSFSERELNSLNEFYRSPLGKRIVALEVAATTQQAMSRVREESVQLAEQLDDDSGRKTLLLELDKIIRRSEVDVSLAAAIYTSVGEALDRPTDGESSFDNIFEESRRNFIADVRVLEILALADTYKSMTDGEILEYLWFLNTNSARKFHSRIELTLTVFFNEHGKRFAENLRKSWQEREHEGK